MNTRIVKALGVVFTLFVFLVISKPVHADPNLLFSLKNFFKQQIAAPSLLVDSSSIYLKNKPQPVLYEDNFVNGSVGRKISPLENVTVQSTHPDIAYDPDLQRYLVVWQEQTDPGSKIMGQLRDRSGNTISFPFLISSSRVNRGCFYENFDSDNGAITTPTNCPNAMNPAVAYNRGPDGRGRYLVVWELRGRGEFARNNDGTPYPEGRNFSTIIAKMLNSDDLTPAAHQDDQTEQGGGRIAYWQEGLGVSGIWIASNNPGSAPRNDNEIKAWEQSSRPDVAPTHSNGFLVTWQTNKGFIGCDDPARRDSSSIYANYVHPNFSPTVRDRGKIFAVYTDPFSATSPGDVIACPVLTNVFRAQKPRITYNNMRRGSNVSDLVVAFEVARADSPPYGDIAIQKIILNSASDAMVRNPKVADYSTRAPNGTFFHNPDLISYRDNLIFAYDDTNNINLRVLNLDLGELASTSLGLGGNENKIEPRLSSGRGIAGRPSSGDGTEFIGVTYTQGSTLRAVVLDRTLNISKTPFSISNSRLTGNHLAELAGDFSDFVVVWAGASGGVEKVQPYKLLGMVQNNSPFTPEIGEQPANGVTWAPTRLFLGWKDGEDPDRDVPSYEVYFSEVPADPKVFPQPTLYRSDVIDPRFVIQSSTDGRTEFAPNMGVTPIYLSPNKSYAWKICAKDSRGAISICSDPRRFNTDDSIVGWWRLDEGSGMSAIDSSGKGNDGILINGPRWSMGLVGNALQFDGIDDYTIVGDNQNLEGMSSLTVETWVKTTSALAGRAIVAKWWVESSYLLGTSINLGKVNFYINTNLGDKILESTTAINDGSWHHIVGTYDGQNQRLYMDQVMENVVPQTGVIANSKEAFCIGSYCNGTTGTGSNFPGLIDEVIIYENALSAEIISNKNCADRLLAGVRLLPPICSP